jgi:hypothetical protein
VISTPHLGRRTDARSHRTRPSVRGYPARRLGHVAHRSLLFAECVGWYGDHRREARSGASPERPSPAASSRGLTADVVPRVGPATARASRDPHSIGRRPHSACSGARASVVGPGGKQDTSHAVASCPPNPLHRHRPSPRVERRTASLAATGAHAPPVSSTALRLMSGRDWITSAPSAPSVVSSR